MKKRLSDEQWSLRLIVLAILGLFIVLTFALRSSIMSARYGVVDAEIPVMLQPLSKKVAQNIPPVARLAKDTPMVVLTTEAFYFGDMNAFSVGLSELRNKFSVKHREGAPNIDALVKQMGKWLEAEKKRNQQVLVFLPAGNIPAPIVIQVVEGLKKSPLFNRVVLAGGLK